MLLGMPLYFADGHVILHACLQMDKHVHYSHVWTKCSLLTPSMPVPLAGVPVSEEAAAGAPEAAERAAREEAQAADPLPRPPSRAGSRPRPLHPTCGPVSQRGQGDRTLRPQPHCCPQLGAYPSTLQGRRGGEERVKGTRLNIMVDTTIGQFGGLQHFV